MSTFFSNNSASYREFNDHHRYLRKVEEPAQADPPPVVDELALIEAVSRCDIGVQTDLAGLEYDLVLVPRVQQPSPEAIRQPSPEAIRPRSPEATRLLLPSTNRSFISII